MDIAVASRRPSLSERTLLAFKAALAKVNPYGFDTSKGFSDSMTTFNINTANVCVWKTGGSL
jgi:hypothetical protein